MNQQNSTNLTPPQAFDALASFIREFLVCDDHQLTALTLWIAHTWCYSRFRGIAYLDIRSPQPQSGKTTCLRLLEQVSSNAALVTAATADTLRGRLLYGRSVTQIKQKFENAEKGDQEKDQHWVPTTILIDEYQHSFGSSERQALVAILNCGADFAARYSHRADDYFVAAPKAFAGNTPLPESLASRCIPIVLRRAKFSEPVRRLFPDDLAPLAASFRDWLQNWASEVAPRLEEARDKSIQFPPALAPRQRQCAEPLLRIANSLGGPWPAQARAALAALFDCCEYSDQIQILRDIRDLFRRKNQPEQLPSRDLLSYLCALENRPWSGWGSKSGKLLGGFLRPFGILSTDLKFGEEWLKGYRRKDFLDAWERYAGPAAEYSAMDRLSATA
jgi:Protein of unknown function (DUF3631)